MAWDIIFKVSWTKGIMVSTALSNIHCWIAVMLCEHCIMSIWFMWTNSQKSNQYPDIKSEGLKLPATPLFFPPFVLQRNHQSLAESEGNPPVTMVFPHTGLVIFPCYDIIMSGLMRSHWLSQWWPRPMMTYCVIRPQWVNTLRPRQSGHHFPNDIFKWIFLNENIDLSMKISLTFVPKGPVNNIPALVQIMVWHCPGDKPISEPMMV